jgi:hypothetical protein
VPKDKVITVVFSRDMDPASITADTVTVTDAAGKLLAGTLTYDAEAKKATLRFQEPLKDFAAYKTSVTSGAKNGAGDEFTGAAVSWTTAAAVPVLTMTPVDASQDVRADLKTIFLISSLPLDPATVTKANITLTDGTAAAVDLAISLSADRLTALLGLSAPGLAQHMKYTLTATTAVKAAESAGGRPLATAFTASFTTAGRSPSVVSVRPKDGAQHVKLGKANTVEVTFDQAMDSATTVAALSVAPTATPGTPLKGTVSLDVTKKVAVFDLDPAEAVQEKTSYTVTVAATAADADDKLPLGKPFTSKFTLADEPPLLVSVVPKSGDNKVPADITVSLVFSEKVKDTNPSSIELRAGSIIVPAKVTFDAAGLKAELKPLDRLRHGVAYTVMVGKGLVDADDGVPLPGAPVPATSFTTDIVPPTVTSFSPANAASGVNGNATVTIVFSDRMNPASLTAATLLLEDASGAPVGTNVVVDAAARVATLKPLAFLEPSRSYTVTVTTGAKNYSDVPFASPASAAFTTAPGPKVVSLSPSSGQKGVALTSKVTVTFSDAVVGVSATSFTMTAQGATKPFPGAVTLGPRPNEASFSPTGAYAEATLYSVSLGREIIDANGNRLAPVSSDFTTLGGVPDVKSASIGRTGILMQAVDITGATPVRNVPLSNVTVLVSLEHAMDAAAVQAPGVVTVTDPSGSVIPSTTAVANTGNASLGTSTLTVFVPSLALEETPFTFTLGTGAKSLAGTPMAAPFSFRFTTAPRLRLYTVPHNFAKGVYTDSGIFVVFNKPVVAPQATGTPGDIKEVTMFSAPAGGPANFQVTFQPVAVALDPTKTIATVTLKNANGQTVKHAPNTRYTLKIAGVTDSFGEPLGAPLVHVYETGARTDPNRPAFDISKIVPGNLSSGVDPSTLSCSDGNSGIRVLFTSGLDPSSAIGGIGLTVASGPMTRMPVEGRLSVPSNFPSLPSEVVFCPNAALLPETAYKVNVKGSVRSSTFHALSSGAATTVFVTARDVAPQVTGVETSTSGSGSASAGNNTGILVRFAGPIQPSSLNVVLTAVSQGVSSPVAASVTYEPSTRSALVVPGAALPAGSQVDVTVSAGLKSAFGTATAADILAGSVTVGSAADTQAPVASLAAPAAIDAPADADVVLGFSKNMNPLTLAAPGAIKVIDPNGNPVPGSIARVSSAGATFVRATGVFFGAGRAYTVQLAPGVSDLAGNKAFGAALGFTVSGKTIASTGNNIAAGQLAPGDPLLVDFGALLAGSSVNPDTVTVRPASASSDLLAGVGLVREPSGGTSTVGLFPSVPWVPGQSYVATFSSGVKDLGGLSLTPPLTVTFATSSGPSIVSAVFAVKDATGGPEGGFGGSCATFPAQGAVLDLTQLPGAGSGNSCLSALSLADRPLWIQFSAPLDKASAEAPANYDLRGRGNTAIQVTPSYASNAVGSFVRIDPPNGNWLGTVPSPTGAFPLFQRYTLMIRNVKDPPGVPMSSPQSYGFKTVTVAAFEGPTSLFDAGYQFASTANNARAPNNLWQWHQGGAVKGLSISPQASWVTNATDANYQRDCRPFAAVGAPSIMSLVTPGGGFGASAPLKDIVVRVNHFYGYNRVAGDALRLDVAVSGSSAFVPLFGSGGAGNAFYLPAASGQSSGYASKQYVLEEYSVIQAAKLFGGPTSMASIPGLRASFRLTVAGAQTTVQTACPATDVGWILGSHVIVAY